MPELYFSAQLDSSTTLCIAPLSNRRIELSGEELEDVSGYFLYKTVGGGEPEDVEVIARLTSEEAAWALKEILGLC